MAESVSEGPRSWKRMFWQKLYRKNVPAFHIPSSKMSLFSILETRIMRPRARLSKIRSESRHVASYTVGRTCRVFCSSASVKACISVSWSCNWRTCKRLHKKPSATNTRITRERASVVHKTDEAFSLKAASHGEHLGEKRHWHRPPALSSQVPRTKGRRSPLIFHILLDYALSLSLFLSTSVSMKLRAWMARVSRASIIISFESFLSRFFRSFPWEKLVNRRDDIRSRRVKREWKHFFNVFLFETYTRNILHLKLRTRFFLEEKSWIYIKLILIEMKLLVFVEHHSSR